MTLRSRLARVEKLAKGQGEGLRPTVLIRLPDGRVVTVLDGKLREAPPSWLNESALVIEGVDPLVALGLVEAPPESSLIKAKSPTKARSLQ